MKRKRFTEEQIIGILPEDAGTSNAILAWADEAQVGWHYIAPGKPTQNAFIA